MAPGHWKHATTACLVWIVPPDSWPLSKHGLQRLWWSDLGLLPELHPPRLSLPLLKKTRGQNKLEKLMGQDIDKKITYQLPPRAQ